ncbi:MAG: STAS domain-containing protein [Mycobacterium sp.]|nr:STAS domain-containing protein [Mycobacterium sp.]
MPSPLTLRTTRRDDGKPVLTAVGEIDPSNIDKFADALDAAVTETTSSGEMLTVDLSAVEYLDSAAISALFPHAKHIQVIAHSLLIGVFEISRLSEVTYIEPAPPKAEH